MVGAADYGQMGETFPIVEQDLLAVIESKLRTLEANGGIARLQEQMRDQAVASVRRPKPVDGLSAAISRREWLHDPSAVADADVRDQKGNLVVAAGTRVNPLDFVELRQELVFVNGDRKAELDWAVANYTATGAKIIFVAGSPFDSMRPYQRRFYFDQGGALTAKFGIQHTPAVVSAAGRNLNVVELPVGGGS
ncbi:MAG: type-F conjugative transfer system protein TraW [Sphingomonadaceae bacterium]|nr:type-F conjugative transfer system protein TraW [Sphingomonadaceae bacterium]